MQVSTDNGITNDKNERKDKLFYSSQQKPVTDHGVADIIGSKNIESKESPIISGQQEETMFSTESSIADGNLNTNGNEKGDVLLKTSDVAHASHSETIEMLSNCTSLIGEREKHKETDEYRQVMEEEWASRQKQLQFQAKEAQLLRKRRKAEKIRLLDMQKRQKQRLEEIREIQKKDVETTQLKEQIRIEVRKELDMMEVKYKDMASILHALGINVKGGYFPTLDEVNAACKQALVKFHPDRASRTDIRQQIEAEEKFKLISRLKEKLADSSFGCK
ncbi:hypothetical protein HPP92_000746 [Vanilla planifolia]|uniref:J domain-containing protein n=1 Tax=Vanilla planifolia TaxID=51239 RepID=A0A835RYP2_VANPL|nr:hypothetical protein HPP92_000746 [Vanilla planifolia]